MGRTEQSGCTALLSACCYCVLRSHAQSYFFAVVSYCWDRPSSNYCHFTDWREYVLCAGNVLINSFWNYLISWRHREQFRINKFSIIAAILILINVGRENAFRLSANVEYAGHVRNEFIVRTLTDLNTWTVNILNAILLHLWQIVIDGNVIVICLLACICIPTTQPLPPTYISVPREMQTLFWCTTCSVHILYEIDNSLKNGRNDMTAIRA